MWQPPTAVMAVAPAPCVLYSGRPMSEDRRENERVEMLGSMPGATTVIQPLGVKELSRRGAQVETRFALPVDSLREFRLNLSGRSMVVKGSSTVRAWSSWISPSAPCLRFLTSSTKSKQAGRADGPGAPSHQTTAP